MSQYYFIFFAFLILSSSSNHGVYGDAVVSGTVFCDQCKDGQISLFDYPIYGIKVMIECADSNGQIIMSREESTNWLGTYAMRFDGNPDLSNCYAQVSSSDDQNSNACNLAAGPPKKFRLMFRMFDTQIYSVDSLLSQPYQPMSSCPKSSPNPVPTPVNPVTPPTPPVVSPALPPPPTPVSPALLPPPTLVSPALPPPSVRVPPLPKLPPLPPLPPMPPVPFLEASACPHQNWTMPEYKCYWRAVNPETKVAVVFGLLAARRYGTDMTLFEGLQGRGDPYKTLLREATTALLNSYNSLEFPFNGISVVTQMNLALLGSQRSVLLTALRFIRANSGGLSHTTCKFTPCK